MVYTFWRRHIGFFEVEAQRWQRECSS
jgi:hypothetical protein